MVRAYTRILQRRVSRAYSSWGATAHISIQTCINLSDSSPRDLQMPTGNTQDISIYTWPPITSVSSLDSSDSGSFKRCTSLSRSLMTSMKAGRLRLFMYESRRCTSCCRERRTRSFASGRCLQRGEGEIPGNSSIDSYSRHVYCECYETHKLEVIERCPIPSNLVEEGQWTRN